MNNDIFLTRPRPGHGGWRSRWWRVLLGLLFCGAALRADAPGSKEYAVKAAFLFNFTKFVEWPAAAFADDSAPLVIGILGDDPFGPALDEIVQGETVQKRTVVVRRKLQLADLKGCQVLFVSKTEHARLARIVADLGEASVLTVGDMEGFARHGGVINFYLEENKVRFEINPDAARSKGLKLSSQLLKLGRIVGSEAN